MYHSGDGGRGRYINPGLRCTTGRARVVQASQKMECEMEKKCRVFLLLH